MSKKDWQVGPVLKDKLGSQGTLFRGGTSQMSDARYPKGYTPERQKEVADAIVQPSQQRFWDERGTVTSTGTASAHFADRKVRVGLHADYPKGYRNESAQPIRDVVDNVARSTVPVEHLSGLQWRTNASDRILGKPTVAGHYDRRGDAMTTKGEALIRLRAGAEKGTTPIHEIGHHYSHQFAQNDHEYDTSGHSGAEEAAADNYAEEHYRNQKGQQIDHGAYGGGRYAGHIERTDQFWDSYHQNRSSAMWQQHADAENEKYYQRYPEERVHADGSQDVPMINKEYAMTGEEHTTPQPMDINWEARHDDPDSGHGFDWSKYRHVR